MATCEQCNEKLIKFIGELKLQLKHFESTLRRCENAIRYIELKSMADILRRTINKLEKDMDIK